MEEYRNMENFMMQEENRKLREQVKALNDTVHEFYKAYDELIKHMQSEQKRLDEVVDFLNKKHVSDMHYIMQLQAAVANMKYELNDPKAIGNCDYFYPKFRSNEETIRLITEEGKSLARFGDGEFAIAFNIPRQKFQRLDERLARRIWQVVNSDHPNLLIAVADNYGNLDKYNENGKAGIRLYMTEETRRQHQQILSADRVYSDAYVTRPYALFADNLTEEPKKRFDRLKTIWQDKKIIIVEGAQTRLGVGNDLFKGAAQIQRIIAPPTSSFDRYDDILKASLANAEKADLFVLAIGPSSGVLAYDLTEQGYQAVDVGHIDIEYEWFLAGKGTRVAVPNKYNNEVQGGDVVAPIMDPIYESQIIASFA